MFTLVSVFSQLRYSSPGVFSDYTRFFPVLQPFQKQNVSFPSPPEMLLFPSRLQKPVTILRKTVGEPVIANQ